MMHTGGVWTRSGSKPLFRFGRAHKKLVCSSDEQPSHGKSLVRRKLVETSPDDDFSEDPTKKDEEDSSRDLPPASPRFRSTKVIVVDTSPDTWKMPRNLASRRGKSI